jgi:ribose transport system permease protein
VKPGKVGGFLVRQDSLGVVVPLLALVVFLGVTQANFFSAYNVQSITARAAIFLVVGLSQLSVLAIGQLNLALPATSVTAGMLLAYLTNTLKMPLAPALALTLALGVAMGALQGALIAYGGLNPFITTLGLASLYMGALFVVTGTVTYLAVAGSLGNVGTTNVLTVPLIAWLAVAVAVAFYTFFHFTVAGRETLAAGASQRAALFSAIAVRRRIVLAHTFSGALAAAAAVFAVANLAEADTGLGQSWLLPSFVAPVLGGTLLTGGRVTIAGTAFGALLLVLLQTALVLLGVNQYWYQVGLGLVLLLSVLIGQARVRYIMRVGG